MTTGLQARALQEHRPRVQTLTHTLLVSCLLGVSLAKTSRTAKASMHVGGDHQRALVARRCASLEGANAVVYHDFVLILEDVYSHGFDLLRLSSLKQACYWNCDFARMRFGLCTSWPSLAGE